MDAATSKLQPTKELSNSVPILAKIETGKQPLSNADKEQLMQLEQKAKTNPRGAIEAIAQVKKEDLPKEQQEYFSYRNERRQLYDQYQEVSLQNLDSREAKQLYNDYFQKYGVVPSLDRYFLTEPLTKEQFFETAHKGDGTLIELPVLIDGHPIQLSVFRIDREPKQGSFTEKMLSQIPELAAEIEKIQTQGIEHKFIMNVEFTNPQGEFDVIGKYDFAIYHFPSNEIIAMDGSSEDQLLGRLDSKIDRSSKKIATGPHISLQTDGGLLHENNRSGLGLALYSLGRELANEVECKKQIVRSDATRIDVADPKTSYYVTKWGARLEEVELPLENAGQELKVEKKIVPVFDTKETPEQPYKFGYWFPK